MNPRRKIRSSPGEPGLSRQAQGGLIAAALVLIPLLAILGNDAFRAALDFAAGVLSLVSLTASVAWGLIATDRVFLSTRHRLLAQAIHRSTAVASLGFLLLHATVKISLDHVGLLGALVPFGLGITGTSGLIGFGSLAGLLMVVAGSTGAARSALAGNGRFAGRWRALHMLAYPAWCFALVHGLYAGRPADAWVTVMYSLALLGVAAAVSLRLLPLPVKRQIVERIMSLVGTAGDVPGAAEQSTRDMASSPLPGASGIPAQPRARFEREFPRGGADPGDPPGKPPGQPLGAPRGEPRRLAAPSPQLYEATQQLHGTAPDRPYEPAPAAGAYPTGAFPTGAFSADGPAVGGPLSGDGPGTGISAAYRAVSRAGDAPPRTGGPGVPQQRSSDDVPYAERVPMTEELPIVPDDSPPRPASWPTPSPPPPAQAFPQPPTASSNHHNDHNNRNDHNNHNEPDIPGTPGNPGDPYPAYGTAAASGYSEPYAAPSGGGFDPAAPFGTAGTPGGYDTPPSAEPHRDSYGEPQPQPGPLYPPTAGEPWNAPAGERP
ncbi:hypothetical protein SSP531S_15020 [Streptomyces spongiicola]|uniref:Ferric oxidoreductase domain-containing protein n=1 Tax=Streptomyces spongiicola TaxID=1690221 RepID=A0A388SW43_9ACTN|nr:ferric reductase-like transmembrane domain-containing protein [Streptomyces spongiicola]GBQ00092.1 hypothetical protein SSP531S_15020 [Streptomyces spongiicola]